MKNQSLGSILILQLQFKTISFSAVKFSGKNVGGGGFSDEGTYGLSDLGLEEWVRLSNFQWLVKMHRLDLWDQYKGACVRKCFKTLPFTQLLSSIGDFVVFSRCRFCPE